MGAPETDPDRYNCTVCYDRKIIYDSTVGEYVPCPACT